MNRIYGELKDHAPFTILGAVTGIAIMLLIVHARVPRQASEVLFWVLHPIHVLLSALVTAGMFRLHGSGRLWPTVLMFTMILYFRTSPSRRLLQGLKV